MYIPSQVNTPLLSEKGEVQAEVTMGSNSVHASASYAATDHLALTVNGSMSYYTFSRAYDIFTLENSESEALYPTREYGEFAHQYAEFGVGGYQLLHRSGTKLQLEIFGGLGLGKATDTEYSTWGESWKYHSAYQLAYLQTNFGRRTDHLALGCAMRFAGSTHHFNAPFQYTGSEGIIEPRVESNLYFTMLHFEPIAFVKVGGERLKFVTKAGLSISKTLENLGNQSYQKGIYDGQVNTSIFHFSLGVNYTFPSGHSKAK